MEKLALATSQPLQPFWKVQREQNNPCDKNEGREEGGGRGARK